MTWSDFYLICFVVGFLLSAMAFVAGGMRWNLHLPHLPHGGGHLAGGPPAAGHGTGTGGPPSGGSPSSHHASVSPFNFVSFTAFLAWFGGTGFLITRFSSLWFALGLIIAVFAGLAGAAIVFFFLTRVLISREENMDAANYEMAGVLGKISMPIRKDGTGEIIYSQAGTRRTCGARSENGSAIEKGAEVMVAHYEKGIAYVKRWEDLDGE
jgi:membrane protein implicated in regulation of membrane protease activity